MSSKSNSVRRAIATPVVAAVLTVWCSVTGSSALAATKTAAEEEEPPRVTLETSHGNIVLELTPDAAPGTVENFLGYVRDGFYQGTIFHRVIPGFMIQGGGFNTEFQQLPTNDPIENEADTGGANDRGTIAMARTSDPHSATVQFFINVVDNGFLNHTEKSPRGWGYTVFGRVIEGMETVDKIAAVKTGRGGPFPKDVPQETVEILNATAAAAEEKK